MGSPKGWRKDLSVVEPAFSGIPQAVSFQILRKKCKNSFAYLNRFLKMFATKTYSSSKSLLTRQPQLRALRRI